MAALLLASFTNPNIAGIVNAAKMARMTNTTIISTNVNPLRLFFIFLIFCNMYSTLPLYYF